MKIMEKKYTLKCPICGRSYGLILNDDLYNSYLLAGKHKGLGLECYQCNNTIIFDNTNLFLNPQ